MVFAKPASADGIQVTGLILRVKQMRNRRTGETKISSTIVGRVSRMYRFDAMADFQFGPFERVLTATTYSKPFSTANENNQFRVFYDDIVLREPTTQLEPFLCREAPLYLPPLLFSRADVPFLYNFAPRYRSSEYVELEENSQRLPVARKARPSHGSFVKLTQPTPTAPNPLAVERIHRIGSSAEQTCQFIRELFDQRPIWIRGALMNNLERKYRANLFKYALLVCAYYMVGGPWGRSWIRFGYDPRLMKEARFYQMIDFRIQSHVLIRKILERSCGKTGNILCDTSRRYRTNKRIRGTARWLDRSIESPDIRVTMSSDLAGNADDESEEDALADDYVEYVDPYAPAQKDFIFTADRLPTAQQTVYCVSDIDIPEVREIINEEPERDTYDPIEGWLKPGSTKRIRSLMGQYLRKWLEED
ncbi:General transcription factor 3C polypeptide 5 [Fasciola hepatica]|uniref:General transcription factor 3C polypeptide 5 n=1 Tax=Fasciola hepatica TaxID=6192 RepID=A0A4E0RVE2_FASHE|nr:General transcription factor 3C polypeptide 5 [Fasciola hepatica]